MKWTVPAKTFLIGEYAAIRGEPAILLTTKPCFELTLNDLSNKNDIHPNSPAGLLLSQVLPQHKSKLTWTDPYEKKGGLGASSAQFLACYKAGVYFNKLKNDTSSMLKKYYELAWSGKGLKPSGYDVIAQSLSGVVYVNLNDNKTVHMSWSFEELGFILFKTQRKIATHTHLQNTTLPSDINELVRVTKMAKSAFDKKDPRKLIDSVNAYHQGLLNHGLVARHSQELIDSLSIENKVLAIKGCGAMGADIILVLCKQLDIPYLKQVISSLDQNIIATNDDLY